jgi:glycosyltransferase involved in cell wall biosynthesis
MRIAPYPASSGNPYLSLFYEALAPHGVELDPGFLFSPRWLWKAGRSLDAVHFHWPEWLWDGRKMTPRTALVRLHALLLVAKLRGVRVLWTVHNLTAHEEEGPDGRRARRLLMRHADLLICHSEATAREVSATRPRGTVLHMPHGSYLGWYPAPRNCNTIREELGLDPDRPVIACLGRLRDYKGLDVACDAAALLGDRVQLLVAGVPHKGYDLDALKRHMADLPGSVLIPRSLSDAELADFHHATDLILLPYQGITGSGALLAAWSLGRAVVASDLPFFRELIPPDTAAGRCAMTGNASALAEAVASLLAVDPETRAEAAQAQAETYAWPVCVAPVVDAFRGIGLLRPSHD